MVDYLGLAGGGEAAAKMTGKAFVCVMPAKADLESEA
jgi:hypothetical protein